MDAPLRERLHGAAPGALSDAFGSHTGYTGARVHCSGAHHCHLRDADGAWQVGADVWYGSCNGGIPWA